MSQVVLSHVLTQDEAAPALADSADAEADAGAAVVPAAELLVGLLDSRSAKKSVARLLESQGLGTIKSTLRYHQDHADTAALYLTVLANMAITKDIQLAVMRSGIIQLVCDTMKKHANDVGVQRRGSEALGGISKQNNTVKEYIAAQFSADNPLLDLILAALKQCAPTLTFFITTISNVFPFSIFRNKSPTAGLLRQVRGAA